MLQTSSHAGRSRTKVPIAIVLTGLAGLAGLLSFGTLAASSDSALRFERTYAPQGPAHLTISNVNGSVRVVAWDKKTISARASCAPSVAIEDQVIGNDIEIATKRNLRLGHADFEISAPPDTSVTIKNYVGEIELRGINGHVSINSIDSNVHLNNIDSPAVDVRVTTGDIYFDGELHDGGAYSFQSMKGDLDITLPSGTPFNLNARALSENINLGSFVNSLTGSSRGPKGVAGTHLRGGARLTLTTYAGRILLHKK
jgi:DUF4097 and DUF4098 domain-containing protein YvlB